MLQPAVRLLRPVVAAAQLDPLDDRVLHGQHLLRPLASRLLPRLLLSGLLADHQHALDRRTLLVAGKILSLFNLNKTPTRYSLV